MTSSVVECPSCGSQQPPRESDFCFRCRFPLMLIANKYRLEKLLAEGGQGSVYLARHIHLDREPMRVVKIISEELFQQVPTMVERFNREVQVTSALSQRCQHIVKIYDDFGDIPRLGRFFVMEYLEGHLLTELLEDPDALPELNLTAHIFYQLCDAMRFAHRESVIHRDLKPDNIMLVPFEDEPHFLKVLDFGIARPTKQDAENQPKLTRGAVGTPEYMAPEQLSGKDIGPHTDIYAMGCILYEMLTGKTPYLPNGAGQDAFFELVMRKMMEEPPPPSVARPDLSIPAPVEAVVMRALSRTPSERYASAPAMKQALRDAMREVNSIKKRALRDTLPEEDEESGMIDQALINRALATTHFDGDDEEDDEVETIIATAPAPDEFVPEPVSLAGTVPMISVASLIEDDLHGGSWDNDEEQTTVAEFSDDSSESDDTIDAFGSTRPSKALTSPTDSKPQTALTPVLSLVALVLVGAVGWFGWSSLSDKPTTQVDERAGVPQPRRRVKQAMTPRRGTVPVVTPSMRKRAPAPRPRALVRRPSPYRVVPVVRRKRRVAPIRRRNRVVSRRVRPVPRPIRRVVVRKPTSICPASTATTTWAQLIVSPRQAKVSFLRGGGLFQAGTKAHVRCLGFSMKSVTIKVHRPGFRSCIVVIRRGSRRVSLTLKRIGGLAFGGNDYCLSS